MKTLISMALMTMMAIVSFGDQSMQVARAKAKHFAEVQRARAERKILEAERDCRMNSYNMHSDLVSLFDGIEYKKHNLIKSLEDALAEEESRRKAREEEKNKRLVKKLTKESARLRSKNEQLRKELDKTINELAESRSQSKHLSRQLRSLPKSLGRGVSSGPARRRR